MKNLLIISLVILIGITLYLAMTTRYEETFIVYSYPKYCSACGELNKYRCNNCTNCGYCYTSDGKGECVPGDGNGPFFRSDCVAYEHSGSFSGTGRPGYKIKRVYPSVYYWDREDRRHRNRSGSKSRYGSGSGQRTRGMANKKIKQN